MRRDVKYATPRTRPPREVPVGWITALLCLFIIGGVIASVAVLVKQTNDAATASATVTKRHDSLGPTYTHDGEIIRWYVFVDPDTQVQYLVNDRGGCTPRLDEFGNPKGTVASDQAERGLE